MNLQIREATDSDADKIVEVLSAAFDGALGDELVELVSELLIDPGAQPSLSLVATLDHRIVGHILFTKVRVIGAKTPVVATILAPLSVHPSHQRRGIGGQLIEAGIGQLELAGVDLVFVLGHPAYYPRHGFSPAGSRGFDAPYPIPAENAAAWMVRELRPGAMSGVTGRVQCAHALNDPRHWRE